jgi:hypothetical protein
VKKLWPRMRRKERIKQLLLKRILDNRWLFNSLRTSSVPRNLLFMKQWKKTLRLVSSQRTPTELSCKLSKSKSACSIKWTLSNQLVEKKLKFTPRESISLSH